MKVLWKKEEHFQDQEVQEMQEEKNVEKRSHRMHNHPTCLKRWLESY